MASAAPMPLKIRLPSGRRLTWGEALPVASIASSPLPTLAPSTSPSATDSGTMPDAASVAVSSTMARLE